MAGYLADNALSIASIGEKKNIAASMATMPRRLPLAGWLSAGEGDSDISPPSRWATWATRITNRRLARGRCRERKRERPEHEEFPGSSGVRVQSQKV